MKIKKHLSFSSLRKGLSATFDKVVDWRQQQKVSIRIHVQRGKYLERYQIFPNLYYFPMDGSQFYSSEDIHCEQCLVKEHKEGCKIYSHQILELTDDQYQACRKRFGSKKHLWEKLRAWIDIIIFESWEKLLEFALMPKKGLLIRAQAP